MSPLLRRGTSGNSSLECVEQLLFWADPICFASFFQSNQIDLFQHLFAKSLRAQELVMAKIVMFAVSGLTFMKGT
jgi:hypothetical protein